MRYSCFSLPPLALAAVFFTLLHAPCTLAHGAHEQAPLDPNEKDWATRHMQLEHHISNFDAQSFFLLHDFDSDGYWEETEIRRTYGLENQDSYTDESTQTKKNLSEEEKDHAANKIIDLYDTDHDGLIDMEEFLEGIKGGKRLPDLGVRLLERFFVTNKFTNALQQFGPGHHGDDEYEYEIHHFEKYHNPDSPISEFTHPEDVRHFERHDHVERDERSQATIDQQTIIEANIPAKFRR